MKIVILLSGIWYTHLMEIFQRNRGKKNIYVTRLVEALQVHYATIRLNKLFATFFTNSYTHTHTQINGWTLTIEWLQTVNYSHQVFMNWGLVVAWYSTNNKKRTKKYRGKLKENITNSKGNDNWIKRQNDNKFNWLYCCGFNFDNGPTVVSHCHWIKGK